MAQIEVPIVTAHGVSKTAPQVTDVDVLGFRPSAGLKWQLVIGDCKTRRRESPVNRVLWVRGLQEAMGAASSIVMLQREEGAQIERDHKLFADSLDVLLIQEDEFSAYDRAILYPAGSSTTGDGVDALEALRTGIGTRFPALREFVQWGMCDVWATTDHALVLRRLLGRVREVRGELDPRRDDHIALVLEVAAAVGIPFATLVGQIFRGYLKPDQRGTLEDAVRVIVWGGREQYEFYNPLRRQVIAARKGEAPETLALPSWDQFLEVLRAYLEAPLLSFRTPQLLRDIAIGALTGKLTDALSRVDDQLLLHLALRLGLYLCQAAELPPDAADRLKRLLTPRISELVHAHSRTKETRHEQPELPIPRDHEK
jgi:hypothetical protein